MRGEDITDGHIDGSIRIVRPGLLMTDGDQGDTSPWGQALAESKDILRKTTDAKGRSFEIGVAQGQNFGDDLRTTYYFTNNLYTKLFAQTNSAIDKEIIQLLTVWRIFPPFGSLQVAYQRGTSDLGEESTQGNTLFLKLAWVF